MDGNLDRLFLKNKFLYKGAPLLKVFTKKLHFLTKDIVSGRKEGGKNERERRDRDG